MSSSCCRFFLLKQILCWNPFQLRFALTRPLHPELWRQSLNLIWLQLSIAVGKADNVYLLGIFLHLVSETPCSLGFSHAWLFLLFPMLVSPPIAGTLWLRGWTLTLFFILTTSMTSSRLMTINQHPSTSSQDLNSASRLLEPPAYWISPLGCLEAAHP